MTIIRRRENSEDGCMRTEKILVVEDIRDQVELLQLQLRFLGWESIAARDGLEALKQLKLIRPKLILLDMATPRLDGFELARSLKGNPEYRDIPVLAVTALAMPGDRERCLAAGCDDYLPKPFTHRELQEHLRRLLSASGPGYSELPTARPN